MSFDGCRKFSAWLRCGCCCAVSDVSQSPSPRVDAVASDSSAATKIRRCCGNRCDEDDDAAALSCRSFSVAAPMPSRFRPRRRFVGLKRAAAHS